jgi:hypothetical protein
MDTLISSAFEVIFYLVDKFSKKVKPQPVKLQYKIYTKSGILVVPRKGKPILYTIKLPDKDTLLENLFFESTTDLGVGVEINILGRWDREAIMYVEPTEIYSKEFFADIINFILKNKVKE